MVKRIIARARQHSGTIYKMIGAHYGCNQNQLKSFVDMH
jgi:hypothetical protein